MTDILPVLILIFFSVTIILLRSRNAQKSRHTWQAIHKSKPHTRQTIPDSPLSDRIASTGLKSIAIFLIFYCIDTLWAYFLLPDAKLEVVALINDNFELLLFTGFFILIFTLIFVFSEVLSLRSDLEKLK